MSPISLILNTAFNTCQSCHNTSMHKKAEQLCRGEGWEMLRMQIYSMTEVPSEQMKLFGLGLDTGRNRIPGPESSE